MLTLGEAQDDFIDAMPAVVEWTTRTYPGAPDDMDYVEQWVMRSDDGEIDCEVTWLDCVGLPVSVVVTTYEPLRRTLQRDIIDPEDIESVVARLTRN